MYPYIGGCHPCLASIAFIVSIPVICNHSEVKKKIKMPLFKQPCQYDIYGTKKNSIIL